MSTFALDVARGRLGHTVAATVQPANDGTATARAAASAMCALVDITPGLSCPLRGAVTVPTRGP